MKSLLLRVAAVVSVGIGASACSSVPDWVDPTTWLDSKAPPAADNGKTPELADIPGRPQTSTPDEQRQVADSLAADRAQSNYSADQLRAGTEQPAAPPPPAPADNSQPAPAAGSNKEEAPAAEHTASAGPAAHEAAPQPAVAETPAPPERSQAAPAETQAAAAPAATPAVAQSDSSLGFQPSSAPALDPSVAQFVSQSELSRFQQTASAGATSGAVVAAPSAGATGGTPAAVVLFAGDGSTLDAAARAKIHEIADAYRSKGAGFVRVVGHSSSRTPNMPVQQHAQLVFQRSQDRANAVAHELIRDGVPVAKVLVEAVGDSQPIYYESMPKGEEGNRRAEIFLQS